LEKTSPCICGGELRSDPESGGDSGNMLRNKKKCVLRRTNNHVLVSNCHLEEVKWTLFENSLIRISERTHKVGSVSLLKYCSRILVSTALSNTPLTSCPDEKKEDVKNTFPPF